MAKTYSLGLILIATIFLAACGGTATAPKNLAGNNAASQLTAASAVQFGMVAVGATRASSVSISNTAADGTNVTVSKINLTGAGFRLGNVPSLPMVIAPGESVTLGIEFSPLKKGSAVGTVSILSDATNPVLPVALTGNGNSGTQVSVSPSVLNFGNVGVGNSAVLSGVLVAGNSAVTVSTVDQSGQGYSLNGISFPVTLAPGQQVPFFRDFYSSNRWDSNRQPRLCDGLIEHSHRSPDRVRGARQQRAQREPFMELQHVPCFGLQHLPERNIRRALRETYWRS